MGCLICERIGQIERGENPYFVCALSTGYVVLGDHQRFEGYTLFLCKRHVTELYQLPWGFRTRFLQEMSLVAEAVAADQALRSPAPVSVDRTKFFNALEQEPFRQVCARFLSLMQPRARAARPLKELLHIPFKKRKDK